jgi:hypothetical protein
MEEDDDDDDDAGGSTYGTMCGPGDVLAVLF